MTEPIDTYADVEVGAPLTGGYIRRVPKHLTAQLVPANWILHEWVDYWLVDNQAHEVWIGSTRIEQQPRGSGHYRIRFENQLGLATIRTVDKSGQCDTPLHVEVISRKFSDPQRSVDFLRHTLAALFLRVSASPFVLGASTERLVREAQTPPSALFTYYFFRRNGPELVRSIQAVLARPHQRLSSDPNLVRPHQVREIDRESMIHMLRAGHSVGTTPHAQDRELTPLERLRPERIWQHLSVDTFDTPENRFMLAICRRMLSAITELKWQTWFYGPNVSAFTRAQIDEAAEHLQMLSVDHRFVTLGAMVVTPNQSRVLQRKEGYQELATLWQLFQRSREPIFEHMQNAIDLRNVADLYELWVLFELMDEIRAITKDEPVIVPFVDDFGTPVRKYQARFGASGTLHYNRPMSTYSKIPLRPDYLWERIDGSRVILDAKFRMQRPEALLGEETEDIENVDAISEARAKTDDLTKMHAYRDAIPDVRAAVVLYPGTESVFRDVANGRQKLSLEQLLTGDWTGVGAIPMVPRGLSIGTQEPE